MTVSFIYKYYGYDVFCCRDGYYFEQGDYRSEFYGRLREVRSIIERMSHANKTMAG